MIGHAQGRIAAGKLVPGIIATNNTQAIGTTIEDLALVVECMLQEEIANQVVLFLPLRQ